MDVERFLKVAYNTSMQKPLKSPLTADGSKEDFNIDELEATYLAEILIDHLGSEDWYV